MNRTVVVTTLAWMALVQPSARPFDCPPCGPDLCLNDPRFPPKLAAKKKQLQASPEQYPADFFRLLDRDGPCVMAVEQSPDVFNMMLDQGSSGLRVFPWTKRDDDIARDELKDGSVQAFYIFNVRQVKACCGQPKPHDRPDWDPRLSLSKKAAIKCSLQGGNVVCADAS